MPSYSIQRMHDSILDGHITKYITVRCPATVSDFEVGQQMVIGSGQIFVTFWDTNDLVGDPQEILIRQERVASAAWIG